MKKVFSLLLVLMLALSVAVPGMAAGKTKTKITLNQTGTVTLEMGKTLKLTATVTPDAAVTWKSSKKSVATVDANGLVSPVKEGKATITAKAGGKSAKVTVKVVDPKKPTGLTITQGKKATLDIDKTLTLGITLQPAGAESALKFKNSNKKVATVDANGVVTPKKEGKTKITVTSAKNKKAKATITVTVKDPYKPTKVTINQAKKQTLTVGDTLQLTTTLSPSTAKADLTFKSSKKSVATVDANGKVTAVKKGTAKITVTAKNNKKAKATITITVKKAAPSKDLLTYIGMPIAKAAKQLNFKIADFSTDPKPFFIAGSGPASLWASGKKADTALIDEVEIENSDSKYCIAGVTIGMKWSDAQTLLKSSGWTYEGDWRFTRNGIVLEVSPEELDSESKVYHLIADKR